MRHLLLSLTFLLALPFALNASESTPEQVVNEAVKALRANDFAKLITAVAGDLDKARSNWDETRKEPADEIGDMEFNQTLAMLNDPAQTDTLVMMVRQQASQLPGPAELSQQLGMAPMLLMMVAGNSPELAQAPELQFALGLLPDLQKWVATTAFNDPDKAEAAARAFAAGVQKLGIKTSQDIRDLEFDAFLTKVGMFSTTVKESLMIYDIEIDPFLDSITASSNDGKLNLSFTMLGKARNLNMDMVQSDGVWKPKLMETLEEMQQQSVGTDEWELDEIEEIEEIPEE